MANSSEIGDLEQARVSTFEDTLWSLH